MSAGVEFAEVRRLFELVCDLPPAQRDAELHRHTNDSAVIAKVRGLLAAQTESLHRVQQPLADAMRRANAELAPDERLGPWRVLGKIASGGMGAVYRAERADGAFTLIVAIKVLQGFVEQKDLQQLARERQMLADLSHPNIARLLDGGSTEDERPYLVMEYVQGAPIDEYCNEHDLSQRARIKLFIEVCEAVEHAHRHLIVHCDLKPSNVLVRENGSPVLLDFGIARAMDTSNVDAAAKHWFTPAYASPEQLQGEGLSTLSDVYALGLILFDLLRPETAARMDSLGDEAASARTVALSKIARGARVQGLGLPADLAAIIECATAVEPAARYASASALAEDLRRHLAWQPVCARHGGLGYRSGRWIRRNWPVASALLVMLALIMGFTLSLMRERDRAVQAEHIAQVEADAAKQVSDFLVSIFHFADPEENQNRDISARDMLDQGAKRMDEALASQPLVQARMARVIGRAYQMIGEYELAAKLYRQSANLYLSPQAGKPLQAAEVLSQLAVLERNRGQLELAAKDMAQVVELRRDRVAPFSLAMADTYNSRALVESRRGMAKEAEADYRKSLEIRRELAGPRSNSVATTLHNLGLLFKDQGRLQEAEDFFLESLDIRRELLGENHPDVLLVREHYAQALSAQGRSDAAVGILEDVLARRQKIHGVDNSHTAALYNEIGSAWHDQGRFREAAKNYQAALAMYDKLGLGGSSETAAPINNLASAYEDMGDLDAAIPLFRRSLALRKTLFDADNPSVLHAQYNLGRVLMKSAQYDESERLLQAVQTAYVKRYGANDRDTVKVGLRLAELMRRRGDLAAAQQEFLRLAKVPVKYSSYMQAGLDRGLGLIALATGDTASALKYTRAAWQSMADVWGEDHPLVARAALDYVRVLKAAGQAPQARKLLADITPVVESAFVQGSPTRTLLAHLSH